MRPRLGSFGRLTLFATAASLVLACRGRPPETATAALTAPHQVDFGGCHETLLEPKGPGPLCVLGEQRKVQLWVQVPPKAKIEIRAGFRRFDERDGEAVRDGRRYSFWVPWFVKHIEASKRVGNADNATWSLAVSSQEKALPDPNDIQREIEDGTKTVGDLLQSLDLSSARSMLERLSGLAPPSSLPAESRFLLAFFRSALADKEGDFRTALREIEISIEAAEHLGNEVWLGMARHKMALILSNLGRAPEALTLFAELEKDSFGPCEQGKLLNNWAWIVLLARDAGTVNEISNPVDPNTLLTRALEMFKTANEKSCPSKATEIRNTQINLALAHLQVGQWKSAAEALQEAQKIEAGGLFQNLWQLDLAARIDLEAGRRREALAAYLDLDRISQQVGSPEGRLRAALGRARTLERLGDRKRAVEILFEAERLLDRQSLLVPFAEGRQEFIARREAIASLEVSLLLDLGRSSQALTVVRRASSRILRQLDAAERLENLSPVDRRRWQSAIGRYVKALQEIDRAADQEFRQLAIEVAQGKAARDERARQAAQSLDEALAVLALQPSPTPATVSRGELLLTFHPLPRKGTGGDDWVAFAANGSRVAVHRFSFAPAVPKETTLSNVISEPFRDSIRAARKIRVLPHRELRGVDFHALPFDGDVLLAAKPVVYGLDVERPSSRSMTGATETVGTTKTLRRALVVANPKENLPFTIDEADAAEAAIGVWGFATTRLDGSAATADAVRKQLPNADLFHFSGHGRFAGADSEGTLLLAKDQRVSAGVILSLGRVPSWVVLSSCDTGRSERKGGGGSSLSVADAFVLAGAHAVIASVRAVDDQKTQGLFADFYRRWDGESDPALPFQQALLAWRKANPTADWQSFRLIEP